uniref:Glycine-rich cell wall structural protein 1.8-like n=1 Tax=Steinernema glaseri TaxID=37863 RepID=A0A1I7Z4R4_9BILA
MMKTRSSLCVKFCHVSSVSKTNSCDLLSSLITPLSPGGIITLIMSSLRLLAVFSAFVVASAIADGIWPHGGAYGGYGYGVAPHHGYGYGSGYGSEHGHGGDKGYADKFAHGEKADWSNYNYGGHQKYGSGDAYGKDHAEGYGSAHGHDAGYGYGAPHGHGYGYGPKAW